MASGNTLAIFTPLHNTPPATNFATYSAQNRHPVLVFNDTTAWEAVFGGLMPQHYSNGGLTCTIVWAPAAASPTGNCDWELLIERIQDDVQSINSDGFDAGAQTVLAPSPSAQYETSYDNITFTNGAQMDGLVAGEAFRIKLRRDAADVSDNLSGNALFLRLHIKET